jgi:hypothetical protein
MYKQPIIFFGLVIPLLIAASILGIGSMLRGKVVSSYERKAQYYKEYQATKMSALETEAQIIRQRDLFKQWTEVLQEETFSLMSSNLRVIGEKFPSKEFQQTASERLSKKAGFGAASAQKSSSVKFNLRGTFQTVQKALLELETRMPNMQLQDMRIDPNITSETSLLNFQLVYSAWEK